jgi:hypothetical protein
MNTNARMVVDTEGHIVAVVGGAKEDSQRNVALFSAAPEMYLALREVRKALESHSDITTGLYIQILLALKKGSGE